MADAEYFSQPGQRTESVGAGKLSARQLSAGELLEAAASEMAQPAPFRDPRIPLPYPGPKAKGLRTYLWACLKLSMPFAVLMSLTFNYSEVRGASMMPGIHDRDRILVDHLTYAFSSIDRGDVVVMRYPLDPRMDYIKRVVGLPGDMVVVRYGGVWVNGEHVSEPYVAAQAIDPSTSLRTIVKPDHYFVMGDNRIKSSDSRDFGQVPQDLVRGMVRLRVWPLHRFGWIQ